MRAIRMLLAGLAMVLGLGGVAEADSGPVVVELYTSQGCSSCPPADALLTRLALRSDVLPLALHVDYWDYIGWPDHFADPAFTRRQKSYAHAIGSRTVYTPQMVVAGGDHIVGSKETELNRLIAAEKARPARVDMNVTRSGSQVTIRAEALGKIQRRVLVQLVRFTPEAVVDIKRGENAGRTVTYTNIVTEWREVGRWNGSGSFSLQTAAPGRDPVVIILQEEGPGAILAAAALR
jgi:hypothetical protein